MQKKTPRETKLKKLTLDKIVGVDQPQQDDKDKVRIYAYPKSCKSGQHCNVPPNPTRTITL